MEHLETRLCPATHIWIGGQGVGAAQTAWSNPNNWIGGAPSTNELATLIFPSNARVFTSNDDIAFTGSIASIAFTGDFTNDAGPPAGNYTSAGLLANSGAPANTSSYNIGVAGSVTALPLQDTNITVGNSTEWSMKRFHPD